MVLLTLEYFGWAFLICGLSFFGYVVGHRDGYKTGYGNGRRAGQFLGKSVHQ